MAVLAEQITHAVQTVADPDAAAAEVAAAYRAACKDIDAAEAEGDQALVQARVARRAAEQSTERARVAEAAAEEALIERERNEREREWYRSVITG